MVFDEAELFVEGERKLGIYNLELAKKANSYWTRTMPPLYAMVTNYRLILQPQKRKKTQPASIPGYYITHLEEVQIERNKGVRAVLKTGHELNMVIPGGDVNFFDSLTTMRAGHPRVHFDDQIARNDIERLVKYLEQAT